uniref:Pentatricopeptide repeat-containing protein At1g61870-like n=1 Tax=Rhizophora mucronata TaxID=61149 RepID=A0A2P2QB65_RHIMU
MTCIRKFTNCLIQCLTDSASRRRSYQNNLVLKAFVKDNKIDSARDWIEKTEKESDCTAALPKPNIDSYNILLGAYLKNGNADGFDGVVKKVLKMGLDCNLTTYNLRILRLCKNKECFRAKKLLDEMVSKGVKPNSATYNAIIDGFGRLADFVSAKKVLESMLTDGHASPCSYTYYTLIRSMVKEGEFGSALEVFSEIIRRRWVPPFEAVRNEGGCRQDEEEA